LQDVRLFLSRPRVKSDLQIPGALDLQPNRGALAVIQNGGGVRWTRQRRARKRRCRAGSYRLRERRDGTPTTDAKAPCVRLRGEGTKPVDDSR
jgi:hypothetical protein